MTRATVNPGDVGVELPDQPQQGGDNRDAITQALMAQGASAGGAMVMSDPRMMALMQGQQNQTPMPAEWMQYMGMKGQPSGSITDIGWMNALQPWQGGVSVGGQPGNPDLSARGFIGGGSMAGADPNYWQGIWNQQQAGGGGGGGPARYLPGGGLDPNDPNNIAQYYRLMGMGGMGAGAQGGGFGGGGGPSYGAGPSNPTGPTGITDQEMGRAIANPNRGDPTPTRGDSVFDIGTTGINAYGGITGPTSAGIEGPTQHGGNMAATQGQPGSGTSFSGGYGGFGLGAVGIGPGGGFDTYGDYGDGTYGGGGVV